MKSLRNLALALGLAAMSPIALSAQAPQFEGKGWRIVKVGKCTALLDIVSFNLNPSVFGSTEVVTSVSWTGACDAEGLITGRGKVIVDTLEPGSNRRWRQAYEGTARSGIMVGRVQIWKYFADKPGQAFTLDPGTLEANGRTIYVYDFEGGCYVVACEPQDGIKLREQYRQNRRK